MGLDAGERVVAFVCADRWGREITLCEDTGYDHIMEKHRTRSGRLAVVEAAIVRAEVVTHDRASQTRECFYRNGDLPPPDQDDFVKVVVEFGVGPEGMTRGTVVTAYPILSVGRPEMFEAGLDLLGMMPAEVLHIGDSFSRDVVGAACIGIPVAWLNRLQKPLPQPALATGITDDLHQARSLVVVDQ